MSFKDQIIEDLGIIFDEGEFAVPALYSPADDIPKRIPAVFEYSADDEHPGADDFGTVAVLRIQAQGDKGIDAVAKGERITIDPDAFNPWTWIVTYAKKSEDGLVWICNISRLR